MSGVCPIEMIVQDFQIYLCEAILPDYVLFFSFFRSILIKETIFNQGAII
jgi:hypothetical protein